MPIAAPISHNPLMPHDIVRLPYGAKPEMAAQHMPEPHDVYGYGVPPSHSLRNTIITLVVAAAAVVGLKHCSFMKVADSANMKWFDHIKNGVNKLGEWIEKPFVWVYNKCTGKTPAQTPAPAPNPAP